MSKYLLVLRRFVVLLSLGLARFPYKFFKVVFGEKTILYISKKKIKSYSIGPLSQISILLFTIWVANLFSQSLLYDSILKKKTTQISDLKKANGQFEKEVASLNGNLRKIDNYFSAISGYERIPLDDNVNDNIKNLSSKKFKDIFASTNLSGDDRKIAIKIAESNAILDNIKTAARKRISDLEHKVSISGINLTNNKLAIKSKITNQQSDSQTITVISLNNKNDLDRKQGGPFQEINEALSSRKNKEAKLGRVNITDEITYLSDLEKFIQYIPLAKPMDKYYISSNFGRRTDPIKKVSAVHNGMDFAGRKNENVISPSLGKVKLAGKFGAYGNTIIIDHGYGITSRYGHLSKIKVQKGQYVKRGDVIALQGSTGRSTGDHLHYEVRYGSSALNPKDFLQAGEAIFDNEFEI